jgi:hypothetical protein
MSRPLCNRHRFAAEVWVHSTRFDIHGSLTTGRSVRRLHRNPLQHVGPPPQTAGPAQTRIGSNTQMRNQGFLKRSATVESHGMRLLARFPGAISSKTASPLSQTAPPQPPHTRLTHRLLSAASNRFGEFRRSVIGGLAGPIQLIPIGPRRRLAIRQACGVAVDGLPGSTSGNPGACPKSAWRVVDNREKVLCISACQGRRGPTGSGWVLARPDHAPCD